jgi:hypothetical protein
MSSVNDLQVANTLAYFFNKTVMLRQYTGVIVPHEAESLVFECRSNRSKLLSHF